MDTLRLSLEGAWELFKVGLVLGAGLPILFAVGVRLISGPAQVAGADGTMVARPPGVLSRILGWVTFALVLYAVVVGIEIIVGAGMGKVVEFHGGLPVLADKPH